MFRRYLLGAMFLRPTSRKKDGKEHRYRSLIENKRVSGGRQPEPELSLLLDQLKLDLPAQPPPKISPAAVTPASPL